MSDLPMDRRSALKVLAVVAAAPALASCEPGESSSATGAANGAASPRSNPLATGTAWDPDLLAGTVTWERTLTRDELDTLAALCDLIIPADERSPSASQVGTHDFIDEWVSAPWDGQKRDLVLIRGGLAWLDRESATRFGAASADTGDVPPGPRFRDLTAERQSAIADDICYRANAAPGYEMAARFFDRVRDLTATAFWTTEAGMTDLQYIGNVPLERWELPPREVLEHLGLA